MGSWLGLLEDFNLGGGDSTVGVFPAPGTLAVFALFPLFCRAGRRK